MKRKVIKLSNYPTRLPVYNTIITAMALDYWNAPQWLWGALGILFLIIWIVSFYLIFKEEQVDIFNELSKKSNINGRV